MKAPLQPLPVIDMPFSRVAMDVIGPLPCSSTSHQYILMFIDYATRYPEAVSLRAVTAPRIVEELIKWIARLGIPQEFLTDQAYNFKSGVLLVVCYAYK